ncbi:hypothetical protein ACHELOUS_66 [Vibrio phage Achelous]|uniref:Uncharacterized protein n=2 Tax=Thalassavirus TaxID=2948922 RepID=A0A4Y6E7R9_9CAUD|nr:hypothetical protein KNU52_gp066 [Vibrio phage Achelous]YP_010102501.1 hypothetical protein KNU58_gp061 [Vibrio phage Brizo]QIG66383.1 hypothetical protein CHAZLY21_70 [Vibrio phage Chazly21]QKE60931.1 hypothetical protein DAX_70 [Vibrio phage Dax]WBU76878.1 hypothetical protein KRONOS_72 [Vibrio phage Kronos]QCQ57663.1 hypothetical protein ACHELOUS_66 [Vibrio phage Achelous]QDF14479.1 hypothetical protein BRIZO_60 [Vibrio phage Brizo]
MDREESVGTIEWLLKTRKYTEQERNQIIDATNKTWGTVYDKTDRKFEKEETYGQYGLILRRWYENVVPVCEEKSYAM